jgi:tetratricopeptide (TPR) repeat protein
MATTEMDTEVLQAAEVARRYNVVELARILGVREGRIRRWLRAGLIEASQTVNGSALFDFRHAVAAKRLYALVQAGLTAPRIGKALDRLRRWLPSADSPWSHVSVPHSSGEVLVRLESGLLAEPSGQLRLDFARSDDAAAPSTIAVPEKSAQDLFAEAVALESAGRLSEAAAAYRRAMALDPAEPTFHFNLGNVLYRLQRPGAAAECFRRAAGIDPCYVKALNNLGSVLLEMGRPEESIAEFQRVLRLAPTYADAYFNLAEALAHLGRHEAARRNWEAYLRFDSSSPWAEEARRRLYELRSRRHDERAFDRVVLEAHDFRKARSGQNLHVEDLLDRGLETKHADHPAPP